MLVVGHLEGPTVYDVLTWALVSWLVMRFLRTDDEKLWLAVGLAVGIGAEAKQTVALLLVGLAVGFLVNGQRRMFASRWLWAGAVIVFIGVAPNIVWEVTHSWPTLTMDANLHTEHSGLNYAVKFPFIILLAAGLLISPVWLAGLWSFFVDPHRRRDRGFAIAFATGLVFLWVYIPDRYYYLFGIYPASFAAGSLITEQVVDGTRGFFRHRPKHRWLWRSRRVAVGMVALNAVLFLPLGLPVLPRTVVGTLDLNKINYNLGEEIGWHELVDQVTAVWQLLPPDVRRHAVVLTSNYGEAGALIQFHGNASPEVFSGHNSFWSWGPPHNDVTTVVAVGFRQDELSPHFASCRLVGHVHNNAGVHNDEQGAPIRVCSHPTSTWDQLWPAFKNYG